MHSSAVLSLEYHEYFRFGTIGIGAVLTVHGTYSHTRLLRTYNIKLVTITIPLIPLFSGFSQLSVWRGYTPLAVLISLRAAKSHGFRTSAAMDEDALGSSSEEGSSIDEPSWVAWFCMLRNHEFFCEVDPTFIQDRFNLYGLKEIVGPLYGEAMTMILGYAPTGARFVSPLYDSNKIGVANCGLRANTLGRP